MTTYIENPFAGYGNIISGDHFIGRRDDLRVIENRIIKSQGPGNLAIIGDGRIGKSSLVYQAILERKTELVNKKIVPLRINLAIYSQSTDFFRSLIILCRDELEDLKLLSTPIENSAQRALQEHFSWSEGYGRIQRFFQKVHEEGIRIIFILDEFDHARNLFKGDVSRFQGLRELTQRIEWGVNFITISRRSIREIEEQSEAISTLAGVFPVHYLGVLNEDDIDIYHQRLEQTLGQQLTTEIKEQLAFWCGSHPYLLAMLGFELVEMFSQTQQIDISQIIRRVQRNLEDHYECTVDLLRENNKLNKLLEILFGPMISVKQTDIDEFLRYGLIKEKTYVAFSGHFQDYLKLIEREVELWPLWSQTEKALRKLITTKMIKLYGEQWIEILENAHSKSLNPIFNKCREIQQKDIKSFGSRASQNLIDFTYPQDLLAIIMSEWKQIFESFFNKNPNYWSLRFELLNKVRNSLAHNRGEVIPEHELKQAEGYCKEILELIKKNTITNEI